jgi:hypothetical protein
MVVLNTVLSAVALVNVMNLWQHYLCLYNVGGKLFSSRSDTQKARTEISEKLSTTAFNCVRNLVKPSDIALVSVITPDDSTQLDAADSEMFRIERPVETPPKFVSVQLCRVVLISDRSA